MQLIFFYIAVAIDILHTFNACDIAVSLSQVEYGIKKAKQEISTESKTSNPFRFVDETEQG